MQAHFFVLLQRLDLFFQLSEMSVENQISICQLFFCVGLLIIIFLSKNVLGHLFAAQSLGSSDDRRLDGDDGW